MRCNGDGVFFGLRSGTHIHFGTPGIGEPPVVQGVRGEALYVESPSGSILAAMDLEGNLGLAGTLFSEWSEKVSSALEPRSP